MGLTRFPVVKPIGWTYVIELTHDTKTPHLHGLVKYDQSMSPNTALHKGKKEFNNRNKLNGERREEIVSMKVKEEEVIERINYINKNQEGSRPVIKWGDLTISHN
jgi:hypothetical protein